MPGKGDGNGGAGGNQQLVSATALDDLWVDRDNTAGLSGRKVLTALFVLV